MKTQKLFDLLRNKDSMPFTAENLGKVAKV